MKVYSKAERRLFELAHLYKNNKLDDSFVSDEVKELSKLPEATLKSAASTKEKKRKKDGSISKVNAIPERVKK
jgi:hypothetical protein